MTKLVLISDTHGYFPGNLPAGEILIHAGDWVGHSTWSETKEFLEWYQSQPHPIKVLIAGNHDRLTESHPVEFSELLKEYAPDVTYLCDSGANLAGLSFWGSPVSPRFYDWAWNRDRGGDIKRHWDMIPEKVEVLVTHGPPNGILDLSNNYNQATMQKFDDHLGCNDLMDRVQELDNLKLHVFGHIHGSGGQKVSLGFPESPTLYVNASLMNESYVPHHKPVVIEL